MASFVRSLTDIPTPLPGQMVLRADDYVAAVTAETMLEDARAKASAILAEAEQAYEARKEEGFAAGQAEASAEAAAQVLSIIGGSVDYLARAEQDVARTVMVCLRKILGDFDDVELVERITREAIERARGETRITLRVRPEIETEIRQRAASLARAADLSFMEVVGDASLAEGGCRLESEAGVIDCGIDTQLAAIERVFQDRVSD